MHWRLGLDIGTNSIGWAAFELDGSDRVKSRPCRFLEGGSGVRIYSDGRNPKDMQSLAATRRGPRGARRNRDRYLKRRSEFMDKLIAHGLMPTDKAERKELEKEDPWILRLRGLDEELSLHQLGRALFHLQQRRGFKSNRKTDRGDSDKGAISEGVEKLAQQMQAQGARTLGELLGRPRQTQCEENAELPKKQRKPLPGARVRPQVKGNKNTYDFYPTRALIEQEFEALWAAQKGFHGEALCDAAHDYLKDTLLFQRPLKPQPVGKCTLDPKQQRAPKALPVTQLFRIYQEVNNLTVRQPGEAERFLTLEKRNKLAEGLTKAVKLTFDSIRKKALKLPDARFNLESLKRKHLDGDQTAAILSKEGDSPRWGKAWRDLPLENQQAIVEILLGQEPDDLHFVETAQSIARALDIPEERAKELLSTASEDLLADWLVADFDLTRERATAVVNAPLPAGHGSLCREATGKVLAELVKDVITYDEAVANAGYGDHSQRDFDGEVFDVLPYYGAVLERHVVFGTGEPTDKQEKRLGKIANPTVHVALNQIRSVVNALVKRYGPPLQAVVELARDLPLSAKGKSELERTQRGNQKANEERREVLQGHGVQDNYENRLKLRLWEDLNRDPIERKCPYTGKQIGIETLLSSEIEIDHILPFSKTLDDSPANKTVCFRQANRDKGNKSPCEAFSSSPDGYDWEIISYLSANLPNNKSWRFGPDAMERYENKERDFLDRQLNETRYISRLAKTYLQRTGAEVWVTPGRLTSDLRWAWGLDSILAGHNVEESEFRAKNRNDHRNHAIDAIVVGLTDRGLLNRVARNSGRAEEEFSHRLFAELGDPWSNFRDSVRESIEAIIVSHKPDHGIEGRLHEDTAYGVVKDPETGEERLASRKQLASLTEAEIAKVGDMKIRGDLMQIVSELQQAGLSAAQRKKALPEKLEAYSKETGVGRVRTHKTEAAYEVIRHGQGRQKAVIPGENYCMDIIETPDGKWLGIGVTRFQVNQEKRAGNATPSWGKNHPGARHIMRVRKGDLLKLMVDGSERVMKVQKIQPSSNNLALAGHAQAGTFQKRHEDENDSFRWDFASISKLKERNTRLVHVDPAGGIRDPGPPE